jgi:enoyl-CoA hydratase
MEGIELEKKGAIAILTINRPDKMNSLTGKMIDQLALHISDVETDESISVVIIKGEGSRSFSAGSDLKEVANITPLGLKQRLESPGIIRSLTKPIIAMIKGYCLGGGLELALMCDIRIAAEDAVFGFPEITNGWLPAGGGGTQILPRLVGEGQAMLIILTGKRLDASEAKNIGLIEGIYPVDVLEEETEKLALSIAQNPLEALRMAKEAVKATTQHNMEHLLQYERALNAVCLSLKQLDSSQ